MRRLRQTIKIVKVDNKTIKIPKTWKELKKLINILPYCGGEITRFPQDKEFYESYIHSLTPEEKINDILKQVRDNEVCLIKNIFPYTRLLQNLPNVKHYCLWSRIGSLLSKIIDQKIIENFPHCEYFWFENAPHIKSIPEIWHCHVFVKI